MGRVLDKIATAIRIAERPPVRIWLTQSDYLSFKHELNALQPQHRYDAIVSARLNGAPITMDRYWNQPSRIVMADGSRVIF